MLFRWDDIPNLKGLPQVACVVIGSPPFNGGVKTITFGASLRHQGAKKKELKKFREIQLKNAYHEQNLPSSDELWEYGHCAETYPYICNLRLYVSITFHVFLFFIHR